MHTVRPQEHKDLQAAVTAFKEAWKTSPRRVSPGKAAQSLLGVCAATVRDCLLQPIAPHVVPISSGNEVGREMTKLGMAVAPAIFATIAGMECAYAELDGFASIRLQHSGTRFVVTVRAKDAYEFLRAKSSGRTPESQASGNGAPGGRTPEPQAAGSAPGGRTPGLEPDAQAKLLSGFLNLTAAEVAEAGRAMEMLHASLGPGDALSTPAGWIIVEKVIGGSADVGALGMRCA